jgi:hypothetical protein
MLIEFQLVSGKRIISSSFSFFFLVFLTTWQHAKVRPSSDYSTHPPADGALGQQQPELQCAAPTMAAVAGKHRRSRKLIKRMCSQTLLLHN